MGRRGPRKTPTALKRLRGFPSHEKRTREVEPSPPIVPLTPPTWLDAVAKAEWRRLEPELVRLGLLTVLDVTKFAAYCCWYARWRRYEAQLSALARRKGGELTVRKTGALLQHPLVVMAKAAAEMMNRFGSQFGLSPSDRTSLSLPLDPTAPKHDRPARPARPPRDEFETFLIRNRKAPDAPSA